LKGGDLMLSVGSRYVSSSYIRGVKRKKNTINLKILPKTIPAMETPPLYIFKKNKRRNPYSQIVDNFLKRQLILASHFTLIVSAPLRDQLNFFGYFMLITEHKTGRLISPENRITIHKKNKTVKLKQLQNYLAMSLIAQTFENFEAFIKDTYREYLRLNIKVAPALEVAMQQVPRKNSEVIKTLKVFFPSLQTYLNDNKMSWIRTVENVRHSVVHTDQLISEKLVNGNDKKMYTEYFGFKKVKGGKYRITVDKNTGIRIIKYFDNIGFNIFNYVSADSGYPIGLK
jgi:hypothetical protein